jgi:hypothetical protein
MSFVASLSLRVVQVRSQGHGENFACTSTSASRMRHGACLGPPRNIENIQICKLGFLDTHLSQRQPCKMTVDGLVVSSSTDTQASMGFT